MKALSKLWRWRLLLLELTRREFKGRYSSARLGVAWAVLNPLFQLVVFTFVFSRVLHVSSEGFPYPIWALTGLVAWQAFRSSVVVATSSIVDDRAVIKRVPFPRGLIPLSVVVANAVNYILTIPILFVFLVLSGCRMHATDALFLVPPLLVAALALGVGLGTSALCVYYRDVRYLMEPILLAWFYGSPIFYSADAVPARYRALYDLNPLVGIIELSRGIFLRGAIAPSRAVVFSLVITAGLLTAGILIQRHLAPRFVDVL
jgi:lipopolysaccharide transport system permease protein